MPTGRSRRRGLLFSALRRDRQRGRGREGSRRRFLLGDHLGTTRPARGRTTRTSTTRPHGVCTQTDQYRCLLPRPGGQVGSPLWRSTQGAGLPPRDRSSDRNEQHRAALQHHPANAACPRRAVRSGTCMHLLIAGLMVRVHLGEQAQREGRPPQEPVLTARVNTSSATATPNAGRRVRNTWWTRAGFGTRPQH
jgi:hypothetical protein